MSEAGIKAVYRFASRHPSLPVTVIQGVDRVRGKRVAPDAVGRRRKGCPESAIGARRLGRLKVGQVLHERVCGGVDHWYALELQGGDRVSLKLDHRGGLKLELYGIKGISTVATGTHGLNFLVPLARNNRGHRYVRVVAPRDPKLALPYTLKVTMGGNAIESPP